MYTSILTGERWLQELMTGVLMATMSYFLCLTFTNKDMRNTIYVAPGEGYEHEGTMWEVKVLGFAPFGAVDY